MKNCPDCGAKPGEFHIDGCDVERCPKCGEQLLGCGCEVDDSELMPWTGEWPGVKECEELGLFAYFDASKNRGNGEGWIKCSKGQHPEAVHDLNTLYSDYKWDPKLKKHVRK